MSKTSRIVEDMFGGPVEIDPIGMRNTAQLHAQTGALSMRGYWEILKATWPLLTDDERQMDKGFCAIAE